jgi:hypothetical protein
MEWTGKVSEPQELIEIHNRLNETRMHAEELQLHRERVASVKRPMMWRDLLTTLEHNLRMYQGLHQDLQLSWRTEPDRNGIRAERMAFPCATVIARFVDNRAIHLQFAYRRSDETETIKWEECIGFKVDDLDRVQYKYKGEPLMDAVAAALIVLTPLIDARFRPPESNSE